MLLQEESSIVIVDNNPEHLDHLKKVFTENFTKCKTFVYDAFNKIEKPLEGVRIAFFDINLRDLPITNKSEIFNELANAINEIISVNNGPYALVFWTQNKELITDFKEYINERRPETPKPFYLTFIDKDAFLHLASEDLETTLKLIYEHPSINLFFSYQEHVAKAASKTINQLYSIIPNDKWGNSDAYESNLDSIFSKIAIQQLGLTFAKKEVDKAVYESLNPILNHHIMHFVSNDWEKKLIKLKEANKYGDVKYPENFNECELNTFFHIDYNTSKYASNARGLVFDLNKCNSNFDYFFNMNFDNWLFLVTKLKDSKLAEIKDSVSLIAIEISSACDFSQDKERLNKYILGLKTPALIKKDSKESLFESTYNFDYSLFGKCDNPFQIWINYNYVFSALPNDPKLNKPIFLFKKEIMDLIGNRYANYVSRIGITSF